MGRPFRRAAPGTCRVRLVLIFTETSLSGAYVIDLEPHADDRGFFARTWCREEFAAHGLKNNLVQCSLSYNRVAGTLRGLHYQTAPFEESKLVRCTRGSIFDVIVDLRNDSATYRQHCAYVLSEENHRMLYIPEGFAHGFLTLSDGAEVFYQMTEVFSAEHARGVRWDDPAFGVEWPADVQVISERDRSYAYLER